MEDIMPETQVEEEEKKLEKGKRESDALNDKGEEKIGGVITNFISNLVSPRSPKSGVFASQKGEGCCDGDLGRSGGGGVVNNLITNLFHSSEDHGRQTEEESLEKKKKKEEESGKGGIIDNIVSHFPTSIPGQSF